MAHRIAVALSVVACAALGACEQESSETSSGGGGDISQYGSPVFVDAAAEPNFLENFRGRVVLVDFWATWCGPCKMAMPGVQKLHERFQGRPVSILGVNCWERGDAQAFMKNQGYTYGLVLHGDELAKAHNVTGIPTFVLFDFDGNVLMHEVGYDPSNEEKLGGKIEEYLASRGS
jgi:thiol-disulfide isomerase/thioredoxin